MYGLLKGMRVVEGAAFVAGPLCGLYLAQMGADVIRFDNIGGGPDFGRWPLATNGASLYWEGLNKGKRSIAINLASAAGRELAVELATAPGPSAGLFLTNFPLKGFLSHEALVAKRPDVITARVMGQADGGIALDYTVNSAIGVPFLTGPAGLGDQPVNHMLPAWDLLTGAYAAFALLAALRHRQETGQGQEIRIPLSDIAISTIANLGQIAEVTSTGKDRERYGNDVFGTFGRDYLTADGRRVMIMAITPRNWSALLKSLNIAEEIAAVEAQLGLSFATNDGLRFAHRELLIPIVERAVGSRDYGALAAAFTRDDVCWGPYRSMLEAASGPMVRDNPVFKTILQPSGLTYPAPGAPATLPAQAREDVRPAPKLGQHTEEILMEVLGLSVGTINRLDADGTIARTV